MSKKRSPSREPHIISSGSWHYRLVRYGLGDPLQIIKRACPYWIALVPLAAVTGTIRWLSTGLFWSVVYTGYYPWSAITWVFGYKPRYWRGLTSSVRNNDEYYLLRERGRNQNSGVSVIHGYVPFLMAIVLTFTPLIIWVWDFGHAEADLVTALPVYLIALIAYGGLLAIIALGNAWKYSWQRALKPAIVTTYCAVCPPIMVVEPSPAESRAEPAS